MEENWRDVAMCVLYTILNIVKNTLKNDTRQ